MKSDEATCILFVRFSPDIELCDILVLRNSFYYLSKLLEHERLCIVLACPDYILLLTLVLGSGNNKFLAKESNAPAAYLTLGSDDKNVKYF